MAAEKKPMADIQPSCDAYFAQESQPLGLALAVSIPNTKRLQRGQPM
jgi:hypothetical protein